MLSEIDREAAVKIILSNPGEPGDVDDRLCRQFPNIVTDDLIALWREAGERQLAEAEELETYARQRLVK